LVNVNEIINLRRHQWNQAAAMGQELVVQCRGVFLNLNDVDCEGWNLRNDDSPEGISHCDVGIEQLELDCVQIDI